MLGPPSLAFFFLIMSYLEGKDDVSEECKKKFLPTYALDCLFWIPVQVRPYVSTSTVHTAYKIKFIFCLSARTDSVQRAAEVGH